MPRLNGRRSTLAPLAAAASAVRSTEPSSTTTMSIRESNARSSSMTCGTVCSSLKAGTIATTRSSPSSKREGAIACSTASDTHALWQGEVKALLVRALAGDDRGQRLGEDRDVEPDRPVLQVVEVEPHEIVEAELDSARDLPQPGHAGKHAVALTMPVLELDVVAQRQRPRTHERHLSAEHVQNLRQLVDRVAPQDTTDTGHSRVVLDLEQRPRCLVRRFEPRLARSRIDVHRAELEHPELALAESDTAVSIEDGAGGVELDGECDHRPDRRGDCDQADAHDEVECALHCPVETGEDRRPQFEERHTLTRDVLRTLCQELGGRRCDAHLDAIVVRLVDEVQQLFLTKPDAAEDQLVGVLLAEDLFQVAEAAQDLHAGHFSAGGERAEELVVDAPPAETERLAE